MSKTKISALLMSALLLVYVGLLSNTALALLGTENLIAQLMGALIFTFPLLGAWAIWVELKFGLAAEKLAKKLVDENAWPDLEIERRPSGRAIRASADAAFERFKLAADNNANDWHAWFALSLAYDACGDRRRARSAMREAIRLSACE
ncbi:MAG: hypothetical protein RL100_395 [Actinomycetota bacterium]|jgi:tetratricopeptide (TPR) repeat protein